MKIQGISAAQICARAKGEGCASWAGRDQPGAGGCGLRRRPSPLSWVHGLGASDPPLGLAGQQGGAKQDEPSITVRKWQALPMSALYK